MTKVITSIITLLVFFSLLLTSQVKANEIYINTSKLAHTINSHNSDMVLSAYGFNVFFLFDITENLSLSINQGRWKKNKDFNQLSVVDMNIKTYGSAAHYYFDDTWYLSVFYDKWKDRIQVNNNKNDIKVYNENNHSKSYTASVGWGKEIGNYYLNLSATLSKADWQGQRAEPIRKKIALRTSQTLDTTVASLAFDLSHSILLSNESALTYGTQIQWYQLLKDTFVQTQSAEHKRNNLPRSIFFKNRVNQQNQFTTEDYGQITLYAMFKLNEQWHADISVNKNFATDSFSEADDLPITLGLGYQF
jgi:hypothetical protein